MLTVLMATHNGARTLPEVLNAFGKLESPDGGWKLIIVDNGSTDSTKEIIASFKSRLPLSYAFEPILGKSVAQNTGLLNVAGDLVVFTDDDALPRPDWLLQMRASADSQPSFSIFGGSIIPHWEVPPEDWILKLEGSILAITDPAWEEGPIAAPRVFGPNMAVRSEVLKAGYVFDASLGPVGPRYRMGEDTDFVQRIGNAGFRAWHCKRAVVAHMIRRDQMKKEWVLRRAVPSGRANYRREFSDSAGSPTLLLGVPRYIIREILTQAIRLGHAKFSQDTDAVFRERWRLHYLVGNAIEGRMVHKKMKASLKTHPPVVRF
jgi:glycosyltransferase involved in cell wall biosynthesis